MDEHNGKFGLYVFAAMILFGSVAYFFTNKKNKDALNSGYGLAKGKVYDFNFSNYTYYLSYEYYVSGKKYKSSVGGMEKFYCEDETLGCVGKYFEVKYSLDNPEISEINLGRYNEFKPYIP